MIQNNFRKLISTVALMGVAALMTACGGGGGGNGGSVVYYPYETVYGSVCSGFQPTPGCTFNRDGTRVKVSQDPDYNYDGRGSDSMWYVKFDNSGLGYVYDSYNNFKGYKDVSSFSGYVGGTTIGVGTSGLFWEDIRGGMYWYGKNNVLYNANYGESNYGQAINRQIASGTINYDIPVLKSQTNKDLVAKAAENLTAEYGLKPGKAMAVASALNAWKVSEVDRGYTTGADLNKTLTAVFGVDYSSALSAVKALKNGQKGEMRELTNRSAAALDLTPAQAQKFIKGMYKNALEEFGYSADAVQW